MGYSNIEKSKFRYVGYANGVWRIKRMSNQWYAYAPDNRIYVVCRTLAELSKWLKNEAEKTTKTYKIKRFFSNSKFPTLTGETGLTLAEAQAHCKHPQSSSKTCTGVEMMSYTRVHGPWFDGYEEE